MLWQGGKNKCDLFWDHNREYLESYLYPDFYWYFIGFRTAQQMEQ